MKIGIITWFKYENYGTILQAIALQRYLRNNKFEVELVNFDIDDTINLKKSNKEKITKRIYYKIAKEIYFFEKKKHKEEFNKKTYDFKNIIEKNCKISKMVKNEEDYIGLCNNYDILIFGSDQIWNPNWYNPFYYGNYKKITTKLIAYAPSFGVNEIPEDKEDKNKKDFKVIVHYVDKSTGKKITTDVVIEGRTGEDYLTKVKELKGYELISKSSNYKGQMTVQIVDGKETKEIHVTYYYAKKATGVLPQTGEEVMRNALFVIAFIACISLAMVSINNVKKDN